MKIQLSKANAFQIDPSKKYLVLLTTPELMTKSEVEEANKLIRQHFPNMSIVCFNPGIKYKVVEAANAENIEQTA